MRVRLGQLAFSLCACGGGASDEPTPDATDSPLTEGDIPSESSASTSTTSTTSTSSESSSGPETSSSSAADTTSDADSSTGAPSCTKRVVIMGYWPPSNEMLRQWSTNPAQNPAGWAGENWRGHGYDVHAFFPEFPPDGDPNNDEIGQDGAVGSPESDLRVDYQATSSDFWLIVDEQLPSIVVTTSRGGEIGWELEAIEGGHGTDLAADPSQDWISDQHGEVTLPTQATIEPRSWDAISTHRVGVTVASALPLDAILAATSALGLTTVEIEATTSGNFLSGFLGLHGIHWYGETEYARAAGHIHVGFGLPVADATTLIETTLETILVAHPAADAPCP
jgi:hypothetical protein